MLSLKSSIAVLGIALLTLAASGQEKQAPKFSAGIQLTQSVFRTPYSEANILLGIKDTNNDQVLLGPTYRKLLASDSEIGHSSDYVGMTLNAQTGALYPVIITIKIDLLYGEWWKNDRLTSAVYKAKRFEPLSTVGLGYAFTDKFSVSVGYNYFAYNPKDFVKTGESAYQYSSLVLAVKRDLF